MSSDTFFSSLVFGAGGDDTGRHCLHVVGVHVLARDCGHGHMRWWRRHLALQVGRHAGHGDVSRGVMTVTFRQVDTFFRFVHVFFREGGTVGVGVVSTAVLGEVVGAGESLIAQMADVGTL